MSNSDTLRDFTAASHLRGPSVFIACSSSRYSNISIFFVNFFFLSVFLVILPFPLRFLCTNWKWAQKTIHGNVPWDVLGHQLNTTIAVRKTYSSIALFKSTKPIKVTLTLTLSPILNLEWPLNIIIRGYREKSVLSWFEWWVPLQCSPWCLYLPVLETVDWTTATRTWSLTSFPPTITANWGQALLQGIEPCSLQCFSPVPPRHTTFNNLVTFNSG